jgi:hypothetical protein
MLIDIGWLICHETLQWRMNRFGGTVGINLSWMETEKRRRESPPPRPLSTTKSAPPDSNKKLGTEYKNQKPTFRGPAGVQKKSVCRSTPTLRNIREADLTDPKNLRELYTQAIACGILGPSDSERLLFYAAAERAKAVATRNAPGLFVWLLRGKRWRYLTQSDEDAAHAKLNGVPNLYLDGASERGTATVLTQWVSDILAAWGACGQSNATVPTRRHVGAETRQSWPGKALPWHERLQVHHERPVAEVERRSTRIEFQACSSPVA